MSLHVLSSMATRQILGELAAQFEQQSGEAVRVESVGGVDAAKRVRAEEAFDVVVLAANVVDALIGEGHLTGGRVDVVTSAIGLGVRAGAARPDISSGDAVKRAVLAAGRIGYSTGPSGLYLRRLFDGWGIGEETKGKTVVAPPGVPVTALVARGDVDLGFQQLSELAGDGVDVVGELPADIQSLTTFSGGVARTSAQSEAAARLLAFMAAPERADVKRRHLFKVT
jgi:molybdate transport system substrate-binding protein